MHKEWDEFLTEINVINKIQKILDNVYSQELILPPRKDVLKLFELTKPKDIKVIIIGQDPYFNLNQADGIAFSVSNAQILPPSLKNIFKELKSDLNIDRKNGDLSGLVKQGVLLINTVWTVKQGEPNSHKEIGWEQITIQILDKILEKNNKVIVCLFGNSSKTLYNSIGNKSEYVLESSHPSPLGAYRSFFGSKPFSKINKILLQENLELIDWSL